MVLGRICQFLIFRNSIDVRPKSAI